MTQPATLKKKLFRAEFEKIRGFNENDETVLVCAQAYQCSFYSGRKAWGRKPSRDSAGDYGGVSAPLVSTIIPRTYLTKDSAAHPKVTTT